MRIGTAPCLAQTSFTTGKLAIFWISEFRMSTTGFGVAVGAIIPSQMTAS